MLHKENSLLEECWKDPMSRFPS